MLTVGDRFPAFDLKAVVSTDPKVAFTQISDQIGRRQVEGRVLLAEGLHFRVPDRDCLFRQAQRASSPIVTPSCTAYRRTASSFISHGGRTMRTCGTCRFRCCRTSSES